ncbi:MAG: 2-hydroxyacid dehydrogenase [Pseudotabrizicola sp.]|uniref:2-hydroxyacid dehydrogenase n=1 Tax=Pseudotabrizicola sp. TaxID=2939647 RepID=UPI0027245AFB|nr:2-hydroxyacid dehydrogenase [Pseudotabrizicola sp.]MDO8883338.1 2-hydroxyacid dehydrogenase [Pseudotabrizicola sp.]MDP2082399.1 2-hydroxyacid dehydrogenase [Pseudotabrizicola sp.]MDZ7574152.1 2-hydroxyacid dehydrogenase [Pseudotabrizicola sp.]
MRVDVFSTKPHDRSLLSLAAEGQALELNFHEARLNKDTARLAESAEVVCAFVNDDLGAEVIAELAALGVRMIALRSAGFNHVDLIAAQAAGIAVARVPAYSPHAVAEHTVALILALNRKTHRAYNRVREGNFALDGLMGFDMHGKVAGIVGTGLIGTVLARILRGFGCEVLACDPQPSAECEALGVAYVPMDQLLKRSDIITLQCPLTPATHHLINDAAIAAMKPGVMLINTSRGAVIDTRAAIRGLKSEQIGALGLDVYEEEGDLFFEDLSDSFIPDDVFARLLTFPNVLITGHQGFFTREALEAIAEITVANITVFRQSGVPLHPVSRPD